MNIQNNSAKITTSVENIISGIYASDFASKNVDLNIDTMGVLNYVSGMKIRLTFVDSFDDDDVSEWRDIAYKNGASNLSVKCNTSSGAIDLNIEYKGISSKQIDVKWIARIFSVILASWSYHQLHLLNQDRYPFPSV
jgi:hypothetical protein